MKPQQGFLVFAGATCFATAALAGTPTADQRYVEHATAQKTGYQGHLYRNGGHFGDKNSDAQLELAGAPAAPEVTESAASQQTAYQGHLYRNGGHFGDKNSDVKLEYVDR